MTAPGVGAILPATLEQWGTLMQDSDSNLASHGRGSIASLLQCLQLWLWASGQCVRYSV